MYHKANFDMILDKVNHPTHYTKGNIECLDAIKESMSVPQFEGYLKGNIMKYLWRYEHKKWIRRFKES